MTNLETLYSSLEGLKKVGLPLTEEQLALADELEEQLIKSEVLPTLSKDIEPSLTKIKRDLVLMVEYHPGEPISVALSRKAKISEIIGAKTLTPRNSTPVRSNEKPGEEVPHEPTKHIENVTKMTFAQAMSKANQMTPEDFKKYKSDYIDFLVTQQSVNYKVIPCVERMVHYTGGDTVEYAFLFSIECKSGNILVVHENVNPDRSTVLFLVEKSAYDNIIRSIYDFMQSSRTNKRSGIRGKSIICKNGLIQYKTINHDELLPWTVSIMFIQRFGKTL